MLGLILLLQALTVAVSGPPTSSEYLPLHVAEAEDYFAREGLPVTLRLTRAEVGAAEALAQGQVDLAATSLESLLRFGPRIARQSPRVVFGLTAAPPVAVLVANQAAARVRAVRDLAGARVGLSAPGGHEQTWFGALLSRAGVKLTDVDLVSLGARGLVAAVAAGDVAAGLVHEPFAGRLLADGEAWLLADLRTPAAVEKSLGHATMGAAIFARADRLPPDAEIQAFIRALRAAERQLAGAGAEALATKLARRVVGAPDEFAARLEASRALYLPNGDVTAVQLRDTIAMIRGQTPLPPTLALPRPEDMLYQAVKRPASRRR
ncbi:MAG: ABC transporter substrate-binding protein [Candidatus Rokubacteria bacterium]|nr:ABC transporter substrate-binding protein [Candidatus Rokubacteria bacterium]